MVKISRIIFVPQYPVPMRYSEWWISEFARQFLLEDFHLYVLGDVMNFRRDNLSMFSPINDAIEFECSQINDYMSLELRDDDILFVADISFPGFFMNVLNHKRPSKVFAFCHATSINYLDYFEPIKNCKYPIETSHAAMCDKVFVGSKYHQEKLYNWHNTVVTYLPFPPIKAFPNEEKTIDIISASRPNPQKVDLELEKKVERLFGKIKRKNFDNWEQYYKFLGKSKILLITSREDTFGLQIVDAVINGCIPIARNSLAYPEILPREYLYDDEEELLHLITAALSGNLPVPKLLCEKQMNNFYKKIVSEMKGE